MEYQHGYFSHKQLAANQKNKSISAHVYLTPDGREVTVTQVGGEPPMFDDVVDLGPVARWLRNVR